MHAPASDRVALGLGANLGNAQASIAQAVDLLANAGLREIRLSPLYRTAPIHCPAGSLPFVNAAATGRWPGAAGELLRICLQTERRLGRPRDHLTNAPRTIDIDILLRGTESQNDPALTIPHPRLRERLFVLVPLADIAADWPVPPDATPVAVLRDRLLADPAASGWGVRIS